MEEQAAFFVGALEQGARAAAPSAVVGGGAPASGLAVATGARERTLVISGQNYAALHGLSLMAGY